MKLHRLDNAERELVYVRPTGKHVVVSLERPPTRSASGLLELLATNAGFQAAGFVLAKGPDVTSEIDEGMRVVYMRVNAKISGLEPVRPDTGENYQHAPGADALDVLVVHEDDVLAQLSSDARFEPVYGGV